MKINIVYATILGTSQMVAEELEDALSDQYEIEVQDILEVSPTELKDDEFHVFIAFRGFFGSVFGLWRCADAQFQNGAPRRLWHC